MRAQTEHKSKTLFVMLMSILVLWSREADTQTESGQAEVKEHPGDAYPLDFCPVSGLKLAEADKPAVVTHEGREIRFCCEGCPKKFEQDPAAYLKKIDAAVIKQQLPHYPLKTCIVMKDEPLGGDMGEPFNLVHKNRLVRFCCEGCVEEFQKKPDPYMAELDQAVIDKQKESYPIDTCVVSGQGLDSMGGAVEFVHANRLVRFCCEGCAHVFRKDPVKYMAKISAPDEKAEE